jgi:hypothetical protein
MASNANGNSHPSVSMLLDDARLRCELTDAVIFQTRFDQARRTDQEERQKDPSAPSVLPDAFRRMFTSPLVPACEAAKKGDTGSSSPAYCASAETMASQCAAWFYESRCEGESNKDYLVANAELCRMARERSGK